MNQRTFKATRTFWRNYSRLPNDLKSAAREAWLTFRQDPFHPSLRAHKIAALSTRANKTVYSVRIAPDLRVVFYVDGNTVVTLDIGNHDVYR